MREKFSVYIVVVMDFIQPTDDDVAHIAEHLEEAMALSRRLSSKLLHIDEHRQQLRDKRAIQGLADDFVQPKVEKVGDSYVCISRTRN